MGSSLQVRVLGGIAVELEGVHVAVKHGAAELVALLAMEPSGRLRKEEVAQRLWPDLSRGAGGKALDKAVKDVRKALHDDRAVTDEGDHVRLWPHGSLVVDVHAFLAHAKHAHREEQRAAAMELYRGDVLAGADRPWAEPIRTRARLAFLQLQLDRDAAPEHVDLREPLVSHA